MKRKKVKRAMLAVVGIGVSAAMASASEIRYSWVNVCDQGFTCTGGGEIPRVCWCQVDWDDVTAWIRCIFQDGVLQGCEDPNTTYPSDADDNATIEMSTVDSRCDGGTDNGELCTANSDCGNLCIGGTRDGIPCTPAQPSRCENAGGTCPVIICEDEQFLVIELTTESIANLTIKTASTPVADKLDIRFHSKDPAPDSNTLTVKDLTADATDGPITVKVNDDAELKTDPND